MKRIDGQIWIDKKPPYRLKYHINDIDYTVEVAATYDPVHTGDIETYLPAGTVVALKGEKTVVPAVFPDDINGVLGVTINKAMHSNKQEKVVAAVTQSGYLILDSEQAVKDAFPFASDLDINQNHWKPTRDNPKTGVGAPVYWFIGKTLRTVQEGGKVAYTHLDSSTEGYRGKLTFQTPSGYKWNVNTVEDDSMNIAYDNLPIVGTVATYDVSPEGKVTSLAIHLNFSKFDSSVEWNYPYLHESATGSQDCGKLIGRKAPYVFHHGLFANNTYYSQVSSYTDISASYSALEVRDGTDINVETISTDCTTGDDRYTSLVLHTPEELYYRISGEVHYKFDKEHK